MLLSEIFSQLAYGEMNNLAMTHTLGEPDGSVPKLNYERLVNHVNLGLTNLHSRFLLQAGELWVDLVDGQSQYILKRLYQVGNPEGKRFTQYIRASTPVFADDLMMVEQVFDQCGRELALNDQQNLYSIMTPNMNTLRVPPALVKEEKVTALRVVYRADHPKIVWEDKSFDPEDVEVDLPYSHLQALLYYIASRSHNPIGFSDTNHEGNNYAVKYERECANLMAQNLRVDTNDTNVKPVLRGWV